jgi:hypothetical protein
MKIFISWSGTQSRAIAQALNGWLRSVIQSAEPYMSADDNGAGERWSDTVNARLHESNFGILCLTPDNLDSRWLLFEAGALGKSVGTSRVVPLLHGVRTTDVKPPLHQFMMKETTKAGMHDVLRAINEGITPSLPDAVLDQTFDAMWPFLEEKLDQIEAPAPSGNEIRSERELLEEVLDLLRTQTRVIDHSSRSLVERELSDRLYWDAQVTEDDKKLTRGAEKILRLSAPTNSYVVRRRGMSLYVRSSVLIGDETLLELESYATDAGLLLQVDYV